MFLDSLRAGLHPDDETFLERALADRSRNVRATAAELLSALPGSALAARMAVRAAACVAVDRTRDVPTIVVEAPHECDAAMERDGVVAKAPAGRGERSWWLGQLVEATPLDTWPRRLGGRTPEEIVALPVADGWQDELHAAWCRAAVRQRDAAWSRALLGSPPRRRPAVRGRCPWRNAHGCSPPWTPANERCGWRGSSRRTACPRRSSCSGCVRCPGPRRSGGPWSTRSTSRGTQGVIHGASAESWAWPNAASTLPRRAASTPCWRYRTSRRTRPPEPGLLVRGVPAPGHHAASARRDAGRADPAGPGTLTGPVRRAAPPLTAHAGKGGTAATTRPHRMNPGTGPPTATRARTGAAARAPEPRASRHPPTRPRGTFDTPRPVTGPRAARSAGTTPRRRAPPYRRARRRPASRVPAYASAG